MGVKKVDIDNQGYTYSSYVIAGDFVFTSICSGHGDSVGEATEVALQNLKSRLDHARTSMDNLVKVTVTLKRGEPFDEIKPVFRKWFPNGFPARNTILVESFLGDSTLLQIEGIAYRPSE